MIKCLLCQRAVAPALDLATLLNFGPLMTVPVCEGCQRRFDKIDAKRRCPVCGRKQPDLDCCQDCLRWEMQGSATFKNQALYDYNDMMKDYFSEYKFRGDYRLRQIFKVALKQAVKPLKCDLVTVIPVTQNTLETRGFNQVAGLLEGLPYHDLITFAEPQKRRRQSAKNRHDRLMTPQPFKLQEGCASVVIGKKVLIVDDVYTTGRTIRHAADLLTAAGAKTVQGLTLAHG